MTPPPRRLLLLIHYLSLSGMEQQLMHLARGLSARGDDVTVGCAEPEVPLEILTDDGVKVVKIDEGPGARGRMIAARQSARLARTADLVHCTGWDASLWGRVGGLLAGKPVVVTEHALARDEQVSKAGKPRRRLIEWHHRLLGPRTYATVAVAERQDALLRSEGVPAERIVHIPNGVPLERMRRVAAEGAATRADFGIPDSAKVIVHVARFEPLKRQRWTLDAGAALREQGHDVHLLLVGDGSERAALQAEAVAAGRDWAHFAGIRDDVPRLVALADLAVLPSSTEALPMAMIEAMALGVPLVTTDVGDMGRVLDGCGAGLTVPVDDHAAFVRACAEVLRDADRGAAMAESGRREAATFDADAMIARYSALFGAALDGVPPRDAERVTYAVAPWPSEATTS